MYLIRNAGDFPLIRQRKDYWCIPASIEAVTKYHKRDSLITQEWIYNQFLTACRRMSRDPTSINFAWIREMVLQPENEFSWAQSDEISPTSFIEFLREVKKALESSHPPIISVPILGPANPWIDYAHMLTPIRYHMLAVTGSSSDALRVHDPAASQNPSDLQVDLLNTYMKLASSNAPSMLILRPR